MKRHFNDTFSPSSYGRRLEKVIGILNPIMWDRRGAVQKFSIYSHDEEDIIIEGFKNKIKLKLLLGKKVEAKGRIQTNDDGEKVIKLSSIKELIGPSSPASSTSTATALGMWSDEYSVSIPKSYELSQYRELQAG